MHDFLSTVPFDLYELALFHLVVKHGSFTKAGEIAGLTQSAITRQVQGVEHRLGVRLIERTTRKLEVTAAGSFLYQESARLLGDVDRSLTRLAQDFGGARKEIRVDVARTIGLAYLPGFFHANLRRFRDVAYRVACHSSDQILSAIEANEQDVGVLCPPSRLPGTVRVTHRFTDAFTVIAPVAQADEIGKLTKAKTRMSWLRAQSWLMLAEQTNTAKQLQSWLSREGLEIRPAMQLDNFDLVINLVSLGMGIGMVPVRALAPYNQKQKLVRVPMPQRFAREVVVVVRKQRNMPDHVQRFIANVLF